MTKRPWDRQLALQRPDLVHAGHPHDELAVRDAYFGHADTSCIGRVQFGPRHTVRMLGPVRVSRSVTIPESELRWRFSRSSGPGGQSVNTADSRVELSVDLRTTTGIGPVLRARALERLAGKLVGGVLTVTASEERSQLRNREIAHKRLREVLAGAVAPPAPRRRPTRASRASVERRLAEKKRRAKTKNLRRGEED